MIRCELLCMALLVLNGLGLKRLSLVLRRDAAACMAG